MSSMRERMNRLRGSQEAVTEGQPADQPESAQAVVPASARQETAAGSSLAAAVKGDDHEAVWTKLQVTERGNEWGSFLQREVRYSLEHRHGHHMLSELADTALHLKAFHSDESGLAAPAMDNLLFLDLETTGLGAGAGNIPFMAGLAFVEERQFVIIQYLIRHPAEERAMLADLQDRMDSFQYLVTYNGRTFDWPVLAGRFIMNGLDRAELKLKHLDFLHPSRSIWRNTLASCKLSYVEEERLGIHRVDDVPGSEAPAIYFQFLADSNPAPLEGVFVHNELDMLAMACLSIRFGRLLDNRIAGERYAPEKPEEWIRTGLWLERMGQTQQAEALFRIIMETDPEGEPSLLLLAARDKKIGNWERAVLLWQKVAMKGHVLYTSVYEAHIELAMYYEHRAKQLDTALAYAKGAQRVISDRAHLHRADAKRRAEQEALSNRIERLTRKLSR
ncbi:ribonuclease H-like domain-containing protein [Paenibacillus sp. GCM10012307]|uniref:Ribonuclease H-like domain-containing protein n=1 Tax=Paenibacillus roseus TaxID=2798579 RepID=A0A934MMR9_9BACL|nr:ribonuclease H-like domain-containing protein [Paenibacillus roseus]MBJ6363655.1 ribonuclease H-like domain-containing protein [Paenibacillus roseus]